LFFWTIEHQPLPEDSKISRQPMNLMPGSATGGNGHVSKAHEPPFPWTARYPSRDNSVPERRLELNLKTMPGDQGVSGDSGLSVACSSLPRQVLTPVQLGLTAT
jgi:hypothetical protein